MRIRDISQLRIMIKNVEIPKKSNFVHLGPILAIFLDFWKANVLSQIS